MITTFFKLLSDKAKLPTMALPGDAAFDLYSAEDVTIPSKGSYEVDTGIAWDPRFDATNYKSLEQKEFFRNLVQFFKIAGIIKGRSGLSFKKHIEVGAGVIDSAYRGTIKVKLYNNGKGFWDVHVGDRIAQLLVVALPEVQAKVTHTLTSTDRGENGFGSSGEK